MSRARVAVLKVISKELSVSAAAAEYGYSRQHLHRLIARYKASGLDAVEPRSRRPGSSPQATEDKVREFIVAIRLELTAAGWDAGPVTIAWHLEQAGLHVPSTSTIRRVLHAAGLVTPEPRKRPRSSYLRFEAAQPNQCWQSDFTHWPLAGGQDAEIINWPGRPLPLPAGLQRLVPGHRQGRRRHVPAGRQRLRTARRDAHGQRAGLYRPVRRRPQRLRVPPGRPRHHPEERPALSPPDPGQGRTIPPDPETLARRAAARSHPRRPAAAARRLPRALQRAPAQPGPAPLNPGPRLPRPAEGRALRRPPQLLPAALRPRRPRRQGQHPPRRPHAPPGH
jgi:transposase